MSLGRLLQNFWGLFMGASVQYWQAPRTHRFPETTQSIGDKIVLFVGGMGNRLWLKCSDGSLLFSSETSCLEEPIPGSSRLWEKGSARAEILSLSRSQAVWIPDSQTLFVGTPFFHRVFPVIPRKGAVLVESWISDIDILVRKYPNAKIVVPAEGPVGDLRDLTTYKEYLTSLLDHSRDFSSVRSLTEGWSEIIGTTSFADNFDHVRGLK